jgi:hypothetical protein
MIISSQIVNSTLTLILCKALILKERVNMVVKLIKLTVMELMLIIMGTQTILVKFQFISYIVIARFLIRVNDVWKFYWDIGVLVLAVFICFLLPVEIAFEPPWGHTMGFKVYEMITEAIFSLDVLLHFNTTLYDENGEEVLSRFHIALDYVKETHFWIDMASTITIKNGPKVLKLLPTLKVIRITSLS